MPRHAKEEVDIFFNMEGLMKKLIILSLILLSTKANADQYVNGYYRNNGTYVQPHYQTQPDNNIYNNYSTQGNVNPYTGQQGNGNPYQQYQAPARVYNPYYRR